MLAENLFSKTNLPPLKKRLTRTVAAVERRPRVGCSIEDCCVCLMLTENLFSKTNLPSSKKVWLERSQQLRGDRGEDVQSKIAVFGWCWLKIYFQRPTSGKDRGLRSKQHSTPKTSRPKRHRLTESLYPHKKSDCYKTVACAISCQIIKPKIGLERSQQVWAVQAERMCRKTEGLEDWLRIDAKLVWADISQTIFQGCTATLHIRQTQTTLPHRHRLTESLYPHKKSDCYKTVACADKGTRTPTPLGIRS